MKTAKKDRTRCRRFREAEAGFFIAEIPQATDFTLKKSDAKL